MCRKQHCSLRKQTHQLLRLICHNVLLCIHFLRLNLITHKLIVSMAARHSISAEAAQMQTGNGDLSSSAVWCWSRNSSRRKPIKKIPDIRMRLPHTDWFLRHSPQMSYQDFQNSGLVYPSLHHTWCVCVYRHCSVGTNSFVCLITLGFHQEFLDNSSFFYLRYLKQQVHWQQRSPH